MLSRHYAKLRTLGAMPMRPRAKADMQNKNETNNRMNSPKPLPGQEIDRIQNLIAKSMVRWEWFSFTYYKNNHNGLWMVMPVRVGKLMDGSDGLLAFATPGNFRKINDYEVFYLDGMKDVSVMASRFDAKKLPVIAKADSQIFQKVTGRIAPQPEGLP
jgi:hypothetical protein